MPPPSWCLIRFLQKLRRRCPPPSPLFLFFFFCWKREQGGGQAPTGLQSCWTGRRGVEGKERSGAREGVKRGGRGLEARWMRWARRGGEMRPGVGEKCCRRSGLRRAGERGERSEEGRAIIRPVTRHNGKGKSHDLPAASSSPPKRCHLHQSHPIWTSWVQSHWHTDQLCSSGSATKTDLICCIIKQKKKKRKKREGGHRRYVKTEVDPRHYLDQMV